MNIINAKVARRDVWMDILLFHAKTTQLVSTKWYLPTYLEIQNNTEQFFFLTSTTMEVTWLKLQQFVRQ